MSPKDGYRLLRICRLLVLLISGSAFGCAGAQPPMPGSNLEGVPSITSLSPASGRAGEAYPIEVTILGHGFAETGNTITFGGIPVEGVPSTESGTRMTFWMPKEVPSRGEAPPEVLSPGEYAITVTTPAGTSGPLTFTLTPGDEL